MMCVMVKDIYSKVIQSILANFSIIGDMGSSESAEKDKSRKFAFM